MDKRFIPAVVAAAQAGRTAYRVPASVTLAQWAEESAYGTHMPAGSNNPFGIKATTGEPFVAAMTWEHLGGKNIRLEQRFRKFDTLAAAFEAHARLLATSTFYKHAMAHCDDPNAFATALTGVYATDPHYGANLIAIMKANNLYAFDHDSTLQAPVSVAAQAAAKPHAAHVAAAPVVHSATTKAAPMNAAPATKAAATATASHNILADLIAGVETKIKDAVSALKDGTATAAGASDKVTAAIGSVSTGVDAAKHLATLALNVRSGNFSGAAKDAEGILGDVSTILGKFGISLPLLTEANSLLVKYVG